jgi:branched-chain amino acid aminotransferase
MHSWLNFNGSFIKEGTPVVTANNRGLRYGDGLFETMKFTNGDVNLKELHFERLQSGMSLLKIKLPGHVTPGYLEEEIRQTVSKNRIYSSARVRLMVFRGDGGLYEVDGEGGGFIIQVWDLSDTKQEFNENGLVVGLYENAYKSCDALSNIKSNNYLLYAMAAIHAKESRKNDCLVLNTHKRICEATIANIFWIKNKTIHTPPLSEGCVAGVMRKHLLQKVHGIVQLPCQIKDLANADEVFLTNAVSGLRWVAEFNGKTYRNSLSREIYHATM